MRVWLVRSEEKRAIHHFSYSYSIMCECWKSSPDERPTFEVLSSNLEERLQEVSGYLELRMELESKGSSWFV